MMQETAASGSLSEDLLPEHNLPEHYQPDSNQIGHDWPLRPWLLGGLGAMAGLLLHFITDGNSDNAGWMALAAFIGFAAIFAGFSLDRGAWREPAIAALIAGLVMAGITWRAVYGQDRLADGGFIFAAGTAATLLALPLFQAGFHRLRFKTPYRDTHFHIWTDVVSTAGGAVFVGLAWGLILVLSELFQILQIDLLRDLIRSDWFGWTFSGLTFGAALGTLRNQLKIIGTLQSVVLLVLSLLAVPFAFALIVFLAVMIVSGPGTLWQETSNATPILLSCAVGSFVLANAILRDDDSEMTASRIMRITAFILAAGILPLAIFAAISMGARVAQYGLAPQRLWGLAAIGFACVYGIAYGAALVRGQKGAWHDALRRANLHLALVGCAAALMLAMPIFDFGTISARNQIARLQSGKVSVEAFDYLALRLDFGEGGRKELRRLMNSESGEIAAKAKQAHEQTFRPGSRYVTHPKTGPGSIKPRMQVRDPQTRRQIEDWVLSEMGGCSEICIVMDLGREPDGRAKFALLEGSNRLLFWLPKPQSPETQSAQGEEAARESRRPTTYAARKGRLREDSKVEVRSFTGRQIYVDGKPMGEPFE